MVVMFWLFSIADTSFDSRKLFFHLPFYLVVPHIWPFVEIAVNRRIDLSMMVCFLFKGFFSAGTSRSMPSSSNFSAWTN